MRCGHITLLAERHKVSVHWTDELPSAVPVHRVINVPLPTTTLAYLEALHELGHCVLEHKNFAPYPELLEEAAAWGWAFRNFDKELAKLTKKDYTVIGGRWATYLPGGAR